MINVTNKIVPQKFRRLTTTKFEISNRMWGICYNLYCDLIDNLPAIDLIVTHSIKINKF